MQSLQIRFFERGTMIRETFEESLEVVFVEKGKYDYGYEVNKKRMFRRRFQHSTIIGGFEIIQNKRHMFLIRAHTKIQGYAVIKKDWVSIMKEFPYFKSEISKKLSYFYYKQIYRPLIEIKNKNVARIERRKDYHQLLTVSQHTSQ